MCKKNRLDKKLVVPDLSAGSLQIKIKIEIEIVWGWRCARRAGAVT